MNRRDFLRASALTGAATMLGGIGIGTPRVRAEAYRTAFARALEERLWLLGFRSAVQPVLETPRLTLEGRLPRDLRGTLYRNGPAIHEVGEYRYRHWFDGDGMVQALRFGEEGVAHRGRVVATRKRMAEQEAGRALYPGFGSVPPDPRPVTSADAINTANISVLPHHDRLYALWEAGSPHAIDPHTLETLGVHAFSEATRSMPFSAHPRVEPDGTLWNFGYVSAANRIVLWHVDAAGRLLRTGLIEVTPMTMPHDFIVTRRHIAILLPPLHFDPEAGETFLDAHRWHAEQATRVLVIDKADFERYAWYELPAQWVFHFGNGWEDESGVIRFDGARAADPMVMTEAFRAVMRGEEPRNATPARHTLYRIDTRSGRASEEELTGASTATEFPVIDPRVSTRRHRRVVLLSEAADAPPPHPLLDSVSVLDLDSGRLERYRYPEHCIPEEHLWVSAAGSEPEGKGYLVGTFLDYRAGVSGVNVFEADAVASGPVATASLPYPIPLGFHGKYVAA